MLTKLIDLFCSIFPHEEETYMNAELVGGPHDGAMYVPGVQGGNPYTEFSNRPDKVAMGEVTSIYEWDGRVWRFRHLGKTRPFVGVHEGKGDA